MGQRSRLTATTLLFSACLAVQILLPLARYHSDSLQNFGWTMYAGLRPKPDFTVVFSDGRTATLDEINRVLGVGRVLGHYVDRPRFVPPHLCREIPDAERILIHFRGGDGRSVPCSR